jgi:CspA family cold shock protein
MGETVRGRVETWHDDEGWGVIASDEIPGTVWAHFSSVEMPGYRKLAQDEVVDLRWEQADQDGYGYRATWVRPIRFRDSEPSL